MSWRLWLATAVTLAATLATRLPVSGPWLATLVVLVTALAFGALAPHLGPRRLASWCRRAATVAQVALLALPRAADPTFDLPPVAVAVAGLVFLHELHVRSGLQAPRVGEGGHEALARLGRAASLAAMLAIPLLLVVFADVALPTQVARTHELRQGGGALAAGVVILGVLAAVSLARHALRGPMQGGDP